MTSVADQAVAQLRALAATAAHHALTVHNCKLDIDANGIEIVDVILSHPSSHNPQHVRALSDCYGAWFGCWLEKHFHGQWIALHEAHAPRLQIGNGIMSPMDVVRRRLQNLSAPSLRDCCEALQSYRSSVDRLQSIQQNTQVWNELIHEPRFTATEVPATAAQARALLDPWLQSLTWDNTRVLCLGAGGGRHGPLFARLGAAVTVVDISEQQLAIDKNLAKQHNLTINTVVASMDELAQLTESSCDVVVQPVSSSYLPSIATLYAEIARVLKTGGLYVSQHKQPISLQASSHAPWIIETPAVDGFLLSPVENQAHRESGTHEYLHTLDQLLGSLCRAGFVIEDISEPQQADVFAPEHSAEQRAYYAPPYIKIKARRV